MNLTAIARPYARAVFEIALAKKDLAVWNEFLQTASMVAADPAMQRFMFNPTISKEQIALLFQDVLQSGLNEERKNFIRLLAENHRLPVLPEIAEQFKQYLAEHEKKINVLVSSATALSATQKTQITESLTKRLQKAVSVEYEIKPELLGGAIIRAGDVVIDGSVRGKLNRLIEYIS